ncbi:MAG: polyprenyl synthetase family protein [Chloroflexi bacterium]|nr:polyprenyl synthetase family protein [Chloroflexota bacterium]
MTTAGILSIYEPVQAELREVEATLHAVSDDRNFALLGELLEHITSMSGKHVRPAIAILASKFHPCETRPIVLMATAVELLHIATLVHDDTIDHATVRRGKPTVSSVWGRDVALLLGDYVFARSATFACDAGSMRAMRLFAETVMDLSAGELREFSMAYDWKQTRDSYWRRLKEKTASLFATAAEAGAILSGAPEEHIQALQRYGLNLGMAFQVVDDILDFEGSQAIVGKPVGGDLTQGVMTLPAILLAERYPDDDVVKAVFRDRDDPALLRAAVERIRSSGVMADAYRVAKNFADTARLAVETLPDIQARRSLVALTEYVTQRER